MGRRSDQLIPEAKRLPVQVRCDTAVLALLQPEGRTPLAPTKSVRRRSKARKGIPARGRNRTAKPKSAIHPDGTRRDLGSPLRPRIC